MSNRKAFDEILSRTQGSLPVAAADSNRPLAGLIQELFVAAKVFILEVGCDYIDEGIAFAKQVWDEIAGQIDIPRLPAFLEDRLKAFAWQTIERGIRQFAAKACPVNPPSPTVEPGGQLFGFAGDLRALAMDPNLPED